MDLSKYKQTIEGEGGIHIATVNGKSHPNLAVASDVRVISPSEILISVNEMVNTQQNIQTNPYVVITAFNKDWVGVRIFGKAKFYATGKYYDFANSTFFGNGEVTPFGATKPKGAIVVKVSKIEDYR